MTEALKRLRVSRESVGEELLAFWREHGRAWAREQASYADLKRVADIVAQASSQSDDAAARKVVGEFREIWRAGFSDPRDAFGWNEMNDMLPDLALLAFARGASEAYLEMREQL